jgi:hypothetical protein
MTVAPVRKIGYRRVSGKIGLTDNESGTRGGWVEKRVALWAALMDRGHDVISLSRFTASTEALIGLGVTRDNQYDVLMLEFGGTNLRFYGKDWAETVHIIRNHHGRIYFICDDPDLPFLWNLLPEEDWTRWTILVNAVQTDESRKALQVPSGARLVDYPAHHGIPNLQFSAGNRQCVYLGRPNGRAKQLAPYLDDLVVAGKATEWSKFSVHVIEQPTQSNRRSFYRRFSAAFAGFDNKHAITGWRTGRAYHALFAGVPVVVPNATNSGLAWAYNAEPRGIKSLLSESEAERRRIWNEQILSVTSVVPNWEEIGL